jgi:hypothetical protein
MALAGLELERDGRARRPATLSEVNDVLARYGSRVWPLDLSGAPGHIRQLLDQPALTADENTMVLEHFAMSLDHLVELITEAGREPHVPGGGTTSTLDSTHDVQYPELYVVEPGSDYSRFDRLHVNHSVDGTSVDETLQVLCGSDVRVVHGRGDLGTVTLFLGCPSSEQGWVVSYAGSIPHIGSFTGASDGAKVLVQIIGPPVWIMDYVDDPTP